MYELKRNLVRFAGVYGLFLIAFLIVVEILDRFFKYDLQSSVGIVLLMSSAMMVSHREAEQTGQEPSKKYNWIVSFWMGLVGLLVALVIAFIYMILLVGVDNIGLMWQYLQQETLRGLGGSGLVTVVAISIVLSILVSRLGWGLGLHAGLKRWTKNAQKRL